MIAALLYLQYHTVRNRLVSRFKRLKQPKYLVGAIVGGLYFYFYFFRYLFHGFGGRPAVNMAISPEHLQLFELLGALVLFVIVLLAWIIPHERAALTFTEAEVAFLFPAPITRRTLIHFKLLRSQFGILFTTLLFTLFSRRFGGNAWIHAFGWWLILSTLNLHFLGSSFARTMLLDRGISNWLRRLLVFGLAAAMAGAVWVWAKRTLPELGSADTANLNAILDYAQRVLTAGPALYLLYPFRLVVRPFLAPDAPAFFVALAPALLLFLLHYLWVIYSDVAFEEASVEASQKLAVRIAAVRAGNWQGAKKNQKARRPWFKLDATGPSATALLWKNLIGVGQVFSVRLWISIIVVVVVFGVMFAGKRRKAMAFPSSWRFLDCHCVGLFAVAGTASVAAGFSERPAAGGHPENLPDARLADCPGRNPRAGGRAGGVPMAAVAGWRRAYFLSARQTGSPVPGHRPRRGGPAAGAGCAPVADSECRRAVVPVMDSNWQGQSARNRSHRSALDFCFGTNARSAAGASARRRCVRWRLFPAEFRVRSGRRRAAGVVRGDNDSGSGSRPWRDVARQTVRAV